MPATTRTLCCALATTVLFLATVCRAQTSPIVQPGPLPADIRPQVYEGQCGDFSGHYGPFDYRTATVGDKRLVERWHLDMEMAAFRSGRLVGRNMAGTGSVYGGFAYTLKSFPNHPVALSAVEEFSRRIKSERPPGSEWPIECWYVRALRIAPDDPKIRVLYAIYLSYRGRANDALDQLNWIRTQLWDDANMQYNIGLVYFRLHRYAESLEHARRAYELGFPLTGLRNMLEKAGHWK
jgi:hypothetical protein